MRTITKGVVLAAVALIAPASAQALEIPVTFDNAVLDTPATPNAVVVDPSGPPIKATAAVNEATGAFTVQPAAFDFPVYNFSVSGVSGTIDVILNSPASGKIDLATGKVEMNADFQAQVKTAFGDCNVNTGSIKLSTENKDPIAGQRFPAGAASLGTGPGAMAVAWQSLTPGPEAGCSLIGPFVSGPGGFWISKGIAPPTSTPDYDVAALGVKVKPKSKTVKKNKRAKFKVTITNPGDTDATNVELCAKVGKGKKQCGELDDIPAGAKKTVTVRAKAKKTSTLTLTATGDGVKAGKATAIIKVKRKKQ